MKENYDLTKIVSIGAVASIIGIFIGSRTGGEYIFEIGDNLLIISIFVTFLVFLVKLMEIKQ